MRIVEVNTDAEWKVMQGLSNDKKTLESITNALMQNCDSAVVVKDADLSEKTGNENFNYTPIVGAA